MSRKDFRQVVDEILQRADIVSIISEYLNLKKSGKNFKTLCPFHTEKTPSFIVSPEKQIWHCFGCGEGGNVFGFIMKMENLNFLESCKFLAEKLGIPYLESKFEKEKEDVRNKIFRINSISLEYFQKSLRENNSAIEYLKKRGIKKETLEKFKIGYAPSSYEGLKNIVLKEGFSLEDLEEAGLILKSEKREGYFAWFRDRIIFPIFDMHNRVIGFAGRSLKEEEPKYINSKETPVFQKGKVLYGINFSRNEILKEGYAVIVEGYMDFLTPYQEGFKNLVASMGTSLTSFQAEILSRITPEVVIAYDPDVAGKSATLRGIEILFEKGLKIKIATFPEGNDPDILVKEKGINEFVKIINSAKNFIEYRLENLLSQYPKLYPEDRVKIVKEISPYLASIKNKIVFDSYIKYIATKLNIREETLRESIIFGNQERKSIDMGKIVAVENRAERELLYLMLTEKEILKKVKNDLVPSDFSDRNCQRIVEVLFKLKEEEINLPKIINFIEDEEAKKTLSEILLKEIAISENREKIIQDYIEKIKENKLQEKLKNIQKELENLNDPEKEKQLLKDYEEIVKKIKRKNLLT